MKIRIQTPLRIAAAVLSLGLVYGLIGAQGGASQPKEGANSFAARKQYYDSTLNRPSYRWKCRGIVTLASGGEAEALDVLFARYRKPEAFDNYLKYGIVNAISTYYENETHVDKLTGFSQGSIEPRDAWLWYNFDMIRASVKGGDELAAIAADPKLSMFRRAAAVYAMEDASRDVILDLVIDQLDEAKMPKGKLDHALLLESMSYALMNSKPDMGEEKYEKAFELLVKHFDEKRTPERTKYVMGRHLAKLYGSPEIYVNTDGWRREHMGRIADSNRGGKERKTGVQPKGPTFVGISASGKNIAYVLDLSDSMLQRVNKPKDIKPPPVKPKRTITGKKGPNEPPEEKGPPPRDEDLLPWDKIKNRFDLAREYLKLSLDRLEPDMTFTIIVFGTKAEPIKVTKGMVKVTPGAINQAKTALDAIKVGSRSELKPLGTLMGDTNIQGGFLRAFESNVKGATPRVEYVDEAGFFDGCDTIFLLSDGDPNMDEFLANDIYEPGIRVVKDVESGVAAPKTDTINYQGPYSGQDWLLRDIKRMNLFRHCEIHCIGMGKEANESMLKRIAEIGYGMTKMLGNFDG